jgi:hypothetical protein
MSAGDFTRNAYERLSDVVERMTAQNRIVRIRNVVSYTEHSYGRKVLP